MEHDGVCELSGMNGREDSRKTILRITLNEAAAKDLAAERARMAATDRISPDLATLLCLKDTIMRL